MTEEPIASSLIYKYLCNLKECNDTVRVTGFSNDKVTHGGYTCIVLVGKYKNNIIIKTSNVPCIKYSPHNGFHFSPLISFVLNKASRIVS